MSAPMPTTRVIKRRNVRVTAAGAAGAPVEAKVRLVRAGDAVRGIAVDCACGRTIEIECVTAETVQGAARGGRS